MRFEQAEYNFVYFVLIYFIVPITVAIFLTLASDAKFFKDSSSEVIAFITVLNGFTLAVLAFLTNKLEINETNEFITSRLKHMRRILNTGIMAQAMFIIPACIFIILAKVFSYFILTALGLYFTVVCIEVIFLLIIRFSYYQEFKGD